MLPKTALLCVRLAKRGQKPSKNLLFHPSLGSAFLVIKYRKDFPLLLIPCILLVKDLLMKCDFYMENI